MSEHWHRCGKHDGLRVEWHDLYHGGCVLCTADLDILSLKDSASNLPKPTIGGCVSVPSPPEQDKHICRAADWGHECATCGAPWDAFFKAPVPRQERGRDNMDLETGGVKYDDGKARLDLLAPEFIEGVGQVLTYGAKKYADRNWEKGMRWGRCVGAVLRHIFSWMRRQDIDPESGLHHLDHAACCLMFLRAYIARKIGEDDRKRVFD